MGEGADRDAPALVSGDAIFSSVALGCAHSCGVTSDDQIYCWGSGERGQLGVTTTPATCSTFGSGDYPCAAEPVFVLDGAS